MKIHRNYPLLTGNFCSSPYRSRANMKTLLTSPAPIRGRLTVGRFFHAVGAFATWALGTVFSPSRIFQPLFRSLIVGKHLEELEQRSALPIIFVQPDFLIVFNRLIFGCVYY